MNKKLFVAIAIVAFFLLGYSQRGAIFMALGDRVLQARMGADAIEKLDDGLHLALCGAGSPMSAPGFSGPCVAVVAGNKMYVVDAGTNGRRNLNRMNYSTGRLEAVFLTHFHSDHIDGLSEMTMSRWVAGNFSGPLPVYGPNGVQRVVNGINELHALDQVYRNAHHGDHVAPLVRAGAQAVPFKTPANDELLVVYDDGELTVEALRVDHSPIDPAVAYRFSYKGRTLLISGDTVKSANLQKFAQGVDLLVHEALATNLVEMMQRVAEKNGNARQAKILFDIRDYHTSPTEAAEIARDAGAGHLLYYHIVPSLVVPGQKALFLNGADKIFPDYTIGVDGVAFSLPVNSDEIIRTSEGF